MHKINVLPRRFLRNALLAASTLAASSAWAQTPPVAEMQARSGVSVGGAEPGTALAPAAAPVRPTAAGNSKIPLGEPGSMAARIAACTMCHGATGVQGADAFYPRISGKPAEYLYQQLLRFREGQREYLPMQRLLVNLSDEYLHDIAIWFSQQTPEFEKGKPLNVAAPILALGETLVRHGARERGIPACVACHGDNLKGMKPAIPGLTGLTNEYITAQMGAWQYGIRHSVDPDCMGNIARNMSSAEVQAVAAWLASQDPKAPGQINEPAKLPVECGIQTVSGVQP